MPSIDLPTYTQVDDLKNTVIANGGTNLSERKVLGHSTINESTFTNVVLNITGKGLLHYFNAGNTGGVTVSVSIDGTRTLTFYMLAGTTITPLIGFESSLIIKTPSATNNLRIGYSLD